MEVRLYMGFGRSEIIVYAGNINYCDFVVDLFMHNGNSTQKITISLYIRMCDQTSPLRRLATKWMHLHYAAWESSAMDTPRVTEAEASSWLQYRATAITMTLYQRTILYSTLQLMLWRLLNSSTHRFVAVIVLWGPFESAHFLCTNGPSMSKR